MSTTYRYYIAVNENYSREHPFVVIRREPYESGGGYDHGYGRSGGWRRTGLLVESDHGDPAFNFIEVDEEEANRVIEYFDEVRRADEADEQNQQNASQE